MRFPVAAAKARYKVFDVFSNWPSWPLCVCGGVWDEREHDLQ